MKSKPKILDQLRNKIRRYNYSIRTEKAYVDLNKRFILFHNKKHPQEMGTQEIKDQRSEVGGPQLNSLRLSSSKNLTGQAGIRLAYPIGLLLLVGWSETLQHRVMLGVEGLQLRIFGFSGSSQDGVRKSDAV
jgi:hypothetical protein